MKRLAALFACCMAAGCLGPPGDVLTLGTTTTAQDSGLLEHLLPAFETETRLKARAVVGGTGEILEKGRRGDVDVLLTHSPLREAALVEEGTALERRPVMFNRFLIVGGEADPAGVGEATSAAQALWRIHDSRSTFISRGDESGTHEKEQGLWGAAGLDPATFDHAWYKETGAGQGPTLMVAAELDAYTLVDDATLLRFTANGRATNLQPQSAPDSALRNQYSVTLLDPAAIPARIRADEAARFAEWMTSASGQAVVAAYRIHDTALFTPNANDPEA